MIGTMKAPRKTLFTAIDLFCGCGGLSLGLRRAGFKIVAAIDNDELAVETYRMNHRRTHLVKDNIQSVNPLALMEDLKLEPGDLDLLAGCPPCQGFSTLRTYNGAKDIDDPMNDLVFEFIRFVKVFLPKTLMMENVPALLKDARLGEIISELKLLGYKSNAEILDAAKYGVPQRRLRMILLSSLNAPPSFAMPVRRRRFVAEAIQRLPSPEASEDPIHNYRTRRTQNVLSFINRIPKDGGSRTDLPVKDQLKCHQEFNGFKDVYGRMAWRQPAPTITGGCINPSKGRYIHPDEDRAITLREAAILQGFPRSYKFNMSKGRYPIAQLIGNAFPPKFAEHHAGALYRHLEEDLRTKSRSDQVLKP